MDDLRLVIRNMLLERQLLTEGKSVGDLVLGKHKFIIDYMNPKEFRVEFYIDGNEDYSAHCHALWLSRMDWGNPVDCSVIGAIYAEGAPGWGPFLCDLAMEYATNSGNWLAMDRVTVSSEAQRMWQYYLDNRMGTDIKGMQLDDYRNTLTDTDDDNVDNRQFNDVLIDKYPNLYGSMDPEEAKKIRAEEMKSNALMWAFKKEPTIIPWMLQNQERRKKYIEFRQFGKKYKPLKSHPFRAYEQRKKR